MSISLSLLSLKAAPGSHPWGLLPAVWVVCWAGWGSGVRSALQMCSSSKINCNSKPNTYIALKRAKAKRAGGFPAFPTCLCSNWKHMETCSCLKSYGSQWYWVIWPFPNIFSLLQLEKFLGGWISRRVTVWRGSQVMPGLCSVLLSSFLSPFWYSLGKVKGKEKLYMCSVRNL